MQVHFLHQIFIEKCVYLLYYFWVASHFDPQDALDPQPNNFWRRRFYFFIAKTLTDMCLELWAKVTGNLILDRAKVWAFPVQPLSSKQLVKYVFKHNNHIIISHWSICQIRLWWHWMYQACRSLILFYTRLMTSFRRDRENCLQHLNEKNSKPFKTKIGEKVIFEYFQ